MDRIIDKPTTSPHALEAKFGRRKFLKIISAAAASIGLSSSAMVKLVEAAELGLKPSVIWLHFQECTGCTESLLRTSHPDLAELILDLISLDYHETLAAAAGHQVETSLHDAMEANKGKYVLIVEGAIPEKDGGIYCKVAGKTAIDSLNEVAAHAGAIIALGSCASFGGIPASPFVRRYPSVMNYLSPGDGDDDNITNFSEGSILQDMKP